MTATGFVCVDCGTSLAPHADVCPVCTRYVELERAGPVPIDWPEFWAMKHPEEEYVVEPVVLAGRGGALYGRGKLGKSLFVQDVTFATATGRPVLGAPTHEPLDVSYVDYEMTEGDLRERLTAFGYGPKDDLERLHYYLLAPFPPLDTAEGGRQLVEAARADHSALVVIDTFARAVAGEEDKADTIRAFYQHTGGPLKQAGIAWLRIDHVGHDKADRARGSSGKGDDVDYYWSLRHDRGDLYRITSKSRVPWIPHQLTIRRTERDDTLTHELVHDSWPAGTADCAADLDRLAVPIDATRRAAADTLTAAGLGRRNDIVAAALRYRRTPDRGAQP